MQGEPIAYLTGVREFWSLPLQVTPDVLIPRPETELLVEIALEFIPRDASWRVADLGTGSGAVALAIAHERPSCEIHATDCSEAALRVARLNVGTLAPGRVQLHQGSWLDPLTGSFRVVVSNPPYVAEDDPHLAAGDCRFEPREALTPGPDGLAAIRRLAHEALPRLEPGGLLAFEHGYDQGSAARVILDELGYRHIETRPDLEGRERVTTGRNTETA
jgi:release factor glutamine methyltransferase